MASLSHLFTLFFLSFNSIYVFGANPVFEDGYVVSTVIDGHKLKVNPQSVLPQPGSSDLLILDSSSGAVYTFSSHSSQEGVIKRLAGNGVEGYVDGDLEASRFKKPRSFAVDKRGNMYVADKGNLAIRKISKSGVTTIAGGLSKVPGREDGPGRNATLSYDFDLTFIPETCVLMICDHGHQLVRQINLKPEDCARGSQSVGGKDSSWAIGLGISCLFGFIVGFMIDPYVIAQEGYVRLQIIKTWKDCLVSLGKQALSLFFDIRSVVVSSNVYILLWRLILLCFSHLCLMFKINALESRNLTENSEHFTIPDKLSRYKIAVKPRIPVDQLNDMISWDDDCLQRLDTTTAEALQETDEGKVGSGTSSRNNGRRIDDLIEANITCFVEQNQRSPVASPGSSSSLVRRRLK